MLLLSSTDVRRLLPLDECVRAVEYAFRSYGEGRSTAPGVLSLHTSDGGFHVKAGVLEVGQCYFAAKVNGNFPQNGNRFALPTIQGVVVVSDAKNGVPLALMDSGQITALRTGAATAVAAKYLARPEAQDVTICGCGTQGRVQLSAISLVCRVRGVFAYDASEEQASRFAQEMSSTLKVDVTVMHDLGPAVRQSDMCITCTTSTEPILTPDMVRPGTFIAAVGADNAHKQEMHPDLMARSKVVCDILEQCAVMGDLHHALNAGAMARGDVHAELGEIVAGKKPGRESDEEITIFDSTGMALQDVAVAAFLYEKAQQHGAGVRFDLTA